MPHRISSLSVGARSSFSGLCQAGKRSKPFPTNNSRPTVTSFSNSISSGFIAILQPTVSRIFHPPSIPQIRKAVVGLVPVEVVNLTFGPSPEMDGPSDPMSKEPRTQDRSTPISQYRGGESLRTGMFGIPSFTRRRLVRAILEVKWLPLFPEEFSRLRLISKQLAAYFRGDNHFISHVAVLSRVVRAGRRSNAVSGPFSVTESRFVRKELEGQICLCGS